MKIIDRIRIELINRIGVVPYVVLTTFMIMILAIGAGQLVALVR